MLLNIEPGLIIWTVITFIVLLIVLRKVAWGPILTALEQREHTIRNSLEEAQRARQEAEQHQHAQCEERADRPHGAHRRLTLVRPDRRLPHGLDHGHDGLAVTA